MSEGETLFGVTAVGVSAEQRETMAGQWRLSRIELANWGTFDGQITRIEVPRKGFLLTGPSGSGKSTLLDAIAAVLTPDRYLRFNEAAQSTKRRSDRSLVSYIRGAYSRNTDEQSNNIVAQYLRPKATWSGILLRYENLKDDPVTLVRLLFLKGSSVSTSDISDICVFSRDDVQLSDFIEYVINGTNTRALTKAHPNALVTSNRSHEKFYARLRREFGMGDDDGTLQLLHKTQSAKNLDSLDELLRKFMLEEPASFETLDRILDEWRYLSNAYKKVKDFRAQQDLLMQMVAQDERRLKAEAEKAELEQQAEAIDSFQSFKRREYHLVMSAQFELSYTKSNQKLQLLDQQRKELEDKIQRLRDEVSRLGGADLTALQRERDMVQREYERAEREQADFLARVRNLGYQPAKLTADLFADLLSQIAADYAESEKNAPQRTDYDQVAMLHAKRDELKKVSEQLKVLRGVKAAIPPELIAVRELIAKQLGFGAGVLRFGAELLRVKPAYQNWAGAIERVLRPFSLTLLVPQNQLDKVRNWVDANHLGIRLVYLPIPADLSVYSVQPDDENTVPGRIEIKDRALAGFIQSELYDRFNFVCVNKPSELANEKFALTINGQIKRPGQRYEKDDRFKLDDPKRQLLRDVSEQIQTFSQAKAELEAEVEKLDAELKANEKRLQVFAARQNDRQRIAEFDWQRIDIAPSQRRIAEIEQEITRLSSGSPDLAAARAQLNQANADRESVIQAQTAELRSNGSIQKELEAAKAVINQIDYALRAGRIHELSAELTEQLEGRFARQLADRELSDWAIEQTCAGLRNQLTMQIGRKNADITQASNEVVAKQSQFKERWPATGANLVSGVAQMAGYRQILDDICSAKLPEHEHQFAELLRERSFQSISELRREILDAPETIRSRIQPINDSLLRVPFDQGVQASYLQIITENRYSENVKAFLDALKIATQNTFSKADDAQQLTQDEARYLELEKLMRRLNSEDPKDKVWRQECLDTRRHVTFRAKEQDELGKAIAVHDSGAAMSGGQQQKLAFFCLAAALRYKLAKSDERFPRYGTIVLDEAFDKADARYTKMALDIFEEFGFHMFLATPQKLLQTVEPYIGGAANVENPSRKRSLVYLVPFHEVEQDESAAKNQAAEPISANIAPSEPAVVQPRRGFVEDETLSPAEDARRAPDELAENVEDGEPDAGAVLEETSMSDRPAELFAPAEVAEPVEPAQLDLWGE